MKSARIACLIFVLSVSLFGQSKQTSQFKGSAKSPLLSHAGSVRFRTAQESSYLASPSAIPQAASGLNFASVVDYGSGGNGAHAVAVGDVNGDGKPDLVVANECGDGNGTCETSTIGVLLGNGDGTFQTAVTYSSNGVRTRSLALADVNGDGKLDLLVTSCCGSDENVGVLLGNGDGTFQPVVSYRSGGEYALTVVVADLNGDQKPDLVVANASSGSVGVLLGNGDGTFQSGVSYGSGGNDSDVNSVAVADVNGDGKLDIVTANVNGSSPRGSVGVLLGNGDGTFRKAVAYDSGGVGALAVAIGDVSGDGKPDLLVANCGGADGCNGGDGVAAVLLGNGDGTFQAPVTYDAGGYDTNSVVLGDVNGDGKPDVICGNNGSAANVGVLLGNGDGTFQKVATYNSNATQGTGSAALTVAVADVNGDAKPDLIVASLEFTVGALINTSVQSTATALASSLNPSNFGQTVTYTATVTPQPGFYKGAATGTVSFFDTATGTNMGSSSLNGSGVATVQFSTLGPSTHSIVATYHGGTNFASSVSPILTQVVLGAAARFSASALNFGNQTVGITSATQTVFLLNTGDIPLNFTSIAMGGLDPGDFRQTNNCGPSLAAQASCIIFITFTPTKTGSRSAAMVFMDNAPSKVQRILLSGQGVLPSVSFFSTSLTFPRQVIFTTSLVKTVELTNVGLGVLNISSIGASGPFHQTNDCGSTVPAGSGCTITVTFRPTTIGALAGAISVRDNAPASPQKVALSGTGTAVKLSPVAIGFGDQPVNTTSLARTITFSNKSHSTVNITSIAITGPYRDDFAETNTCGTSVASGASCFIKVKFTPRGKGSQTAAVSITDDGGGSPQTVGLAGTGTP